MKDLFSFFANLSDLLKKAFDSWREWRAKKIKNNALKRKFDKDSRTNNLLNPDSDNL